MSKKGKKGESEGIEKILKLIGGLILIAVVQAYLAPLNPETLIENWGLGMIGFIIFSILYLVSCYMDIEKFLFIPKKLWLFMMIFSICWILIDWSDFISFMQGG